MKKRILSVLLAIVMVVGMFPVTAGAMPAPPAVETHAHDMSVDCGGSGVTFEPWDGTTTFPGGNVYLTKDVTLADTLTISSGTVNLCLNGHTISAAGGYFDVAGTGTLNLCSCKDNGIIKRTTTTNALISADNGATANLYNVTLDGGAVWGGAMDSVLERGTTNSSRITSSAPLIDAGGQYTDGGFVVLTNCELCNNVCSGAGEGGAITVGRQGRLIATKTNVYNNAKTDGQAGAIKAYIGATVMLTECELYGNKAVTHGGAIQIWGGNSPGNIVHMTMTDCTVRNNKAGGVGGGIAVSDYSQFIMNGGSIEDNATTDSSKRGGGVGFADANTEMAISGNAVITDNAVNSTANNLYIGTDSCNIVTVGEMKNGANIGVTMKSSSGGVFTDGGADYVDNEYFTSDKPAYIVAADGNNLKLAYPALTGVSDEGFTGTYDGQPHGITVTAPSGATVKYGITEGTYDKDASPTITKAGTLTVYYQVTKHGSSAVTGSAVVSISKVPLTVTAKNHTITYGDAPANDGVNYDGFVNNETASVLGGTLDFTYSYAQYGNVGNSYTITPKGQTSDNYAITFTPGTLTVQPKEIGISWTKTTLTYNGSAQKPTATATGVVNNDEVTLTVSGEQTNVGTHTATVSAISNSNYKLPGTLTKDFVINKADQAAPAVNKADETISGKNDGKITDVTANMEYRAEGEDHYTAITGETVENLADGKYYVRVKGDSNHNPSTDTAVVIGAGRMLTVTVPQNQVGYTMITTTPEVEYSGSIRVEFKLHDGYSMTDSFQICNGTDPVGFSLMGDTYVYELNSVNSDFNFTVSGVADITAPLAQIDIKNNKWTSFWNGVTFGLFFNETQDVTVTAADTGSGMNSIQYYLAGDELELDEVKQITVWQDYSSTFQIDPDNAYVVYVKVTDNAGNVSYLNSVGVVLDQTVPVLVGIENNGSYYGDQCFKALDDYLDALKVDGVDVTDEMNADNEYTIVADNAQHTVTVTDKAGNVTEYKITVYKNYTVIYKVDGNTVSTQTVGHEKDATAPTIPEKEGYTQTAPVWDKDGTNITADTEINAVYTINKYTVTYVADGQTVSEQTVNHGTAITEPTEPKKSGYYFAGWFSDEAAWDFDNDTVSADVTLYAKWRDIPVYHISGKVVEETDNKDVKVTVSGATVELKLGTTLIATESTDENGTFYFGGQKAGDYNVVVTSGDKVKVVTVLVALHDHDEDGLTVELPQTVTNSIVKHEPAADGKDSVAAGTLVGGLDKVAATVRGENQSAQKVEVKLTVKDTPPVTGTPTAGTEAAKQQAQQKAIQQKAGGKQLVFFDLSVVKTINGGTPVAITDTGDTLLEIRIPFDSGNKWGITIYRYHGDKAEVLVAVREGSTTEGFWVGDDGYIHIYTHKFSTYAVGYTVPNYGYFVPVTPDTVTSADTFDAGIVVYVTMSMLAATGSAVVIGKKRKEEN